MSDDKWSEGDELSEALISMGDTGPSYRPKPKPKVTLGQRVRRVFNGQTRQVKCAHCKTEFTAKLADIKRGWGKFCSKSCKASKQFKKTGVIW